MKRKSLKKAYEITDAKIQFVSLVDKAANKRQFLLKKQEGGKAAFTSYGRIVKADAENHYVTGIVYEPMTEDVHGNFMTEDEIIKAAYWYAKNGDQVDLQHSFEPLDNATVVENWVAKSDFEIDGESIKKGTWLMTVEVTDENIWDGIQKGEITGFSMGGLGNYSEEDTDLSNIEKSQESSEKKSLLKQIAGALGFNVVEKGQVAEIYTMRSKNEQFWNAFSALQDVLSYYDDYTGNRKYEDDEEKIREALTEFNEIITSILTAGEPIAKSLYDSKPVQKAGKSLSGKNKDALQGIYESLGTFLASFDESEEKKKPVNSEEEGGEESEEDEDELDDDKKEVKKEDSEMTRQEVEGIVQSAITKALEKLDTEKAGTVKKSAQEPSGTEITAEGIQKMVEDAIQKAVQPPEEHVSTDQVQEMVTKAVGEAIAPLLKSRGLPSNLNDTPEVKKSAEQHYLHGIL